VFAKAAGCGVTMISDTDQNQIDRLNAIINGSENIVFFGGAGVSTESGIPDFRSGKGLYNKSGYSTPPERILSHSFFFSNTGEFFDYYRENILHPEASPNPAHKKLAELERAGKLSAVITQNIDGLHQKAGSINVLELHGSVYRNGCLNCVKTYGMEFVAASAGIPVCDCGGIIKPDVVLYEENLDNRVINEAIRYISRADTLIIGGTSLVVYPAAGLIQYFMGKKLVIINKTETGEDRRAQLVIRRGIGEVMDMIELFGERPEDEGNGHSHDNT